MVVVMAGDDGDEQRTERTERTEQKGFATVDVMNLRHTEHARKLQRTIFHLCTLENCSKVMNSQTHRIPPNAAILAQAQQYFWAACR